MTKARKIGIAFCLLAVVIGGLWFYWEWELPVEDLIPVENWTRLELRSSAGDGSGEEIEFEAPLEPLLTQIKGTRVTRDERNPGLGEKYFQITLYHGQSYPTMLYVTSSGKVHIAAELDFDHWKYYEDGGELYSFLSAYSQKLPALFPAAE